MTGTPLQKKIADLGDRFLLRTLGDLAQMRDLAATLGQRAPDPGPRWRSSRTVSMAAARCSASMR